MSEIKRLREKDCLSLDLPLRAAAIKRLQYAARKTVQLDGAPLPEWVIINDLVMKHLPPAPGEGEERGDDPGAPDERTLQDYGEIISDLIMKYLPPTPEERWQA